jgi:hypothetical protein
VRTRTRYVPVHTVIDQAYQENRLSEQWYGICENSPLWFLGQQKSYLRRKGIVMKWEYLSIKLATASFTGGKLDEKVLDEHLNLRGEQGWELVSVFDTNQGSGEFIVAVFKRAK